MKILHIASFIGNLGDLLSHRGFHDYLRRSVGADITIDTMEIRRFHQNAPADEKLDLDNVLQSVDGEYDRIIIGGGGFLDYWVPNSRTGTSLDVTLDTLTQLKTPLLISSVGAYPLRTPPPENFALFDQFLQTVAASDNITLILRNDHSYRHIADTFGEDRLRGVQDGADHCYLLKPGQDDHDRHDGRPYIAVNLAPDQVPMHSHLRQDIDEDDYYREIALGLKSAADRHEADILFIPHLPLDFKAVLALCEHWPDSFVRERFKTAHYDGTPRTIAAAIDLYRNSIANVCARLHSNILSHVLEQPTISLGVLSRVVAIAEQHPRSVLIANFDDNLAETLADGISAAIADGGDRSAAAIGDAMEKLLDRFFHEEAAQL